VEDEKGRGSFLKKTLAARETKKLLLAGAGALQPKTPKAPINKSLFASLRAAQPSSEKEVL
jgi:hypothetical protein